MINLKVGVGDLSKIAAATKQDVDRLKGAFKGAVYLLGCDIITRAMKKTPVNTGYLRASRYVTKPEARGDSGTVDLGFGARYAEFVHDNKLGHHFRVGEERFLEKAFAEVRGSMGSFIDSTMTRLNRANTTVDNIVELQPTGPLIGPEPTRLLSRRRQQAALRRAKATRGRRAEGVRSGRHE